MATATKTRTTKKTRTPKKSKKFQTPVVKPTKKLTPVQMRIAIAKDVLAQLKLKKLRPEVGWWADDSRLGGLEDWAWKKIDEANVPEGGTCTLNTQDYSKNIKSCRVCALGAIFMGISNLYGVNITGVDPDMYEVFENLSKSPLQEYFSKDQLHLLECAFEGGGGAHDIYTIDKKLRGFALAFHYGFQSDKDRLKAIMENIIENNGTFKPETSLTQKMLLEGYEKMYAGD